MSNEMFLILLYMYIFWGIFTAIFYVIDRRKYKMGVFWLMIALILPPIFWIVRIIAKRLT
ncbi:hypothetical protein [Bacillus sp. TL12]|uniref:hypothetical protein n=1 Tax=Bacillus sp. TL12 TaxID=2894756 RepID=UPI001F517A1D|nr:hypothetical protein [Bacillus sp. TL12]MCI0768376.1 hypothetical protein [Bacillus sp. TL12]